jgi:hypothetical protein
MYKLADEDIDFILHDPPGYICPYLQEFLLSDIADDNKFKDQFDVEYLSPATSFPCSFPASGEIVGRNHRLMINLVCRQRKKDVKNYINVIFLINTGSPVSYLSAKAMGAVVGDPKSKLAYVEVHKKSVVQFYLSPPDKGFANVNILGTDFLSQNRLSIVTDFSQSTFKLDVTESECIIDDVSQLETGK